MDDHLTSEEAMVLWIVLLQAINERSNRNVPWTGLQKISKKLETMWVGKEKEMEDVKNLLYELLSK